MKTHSRICLAGTAVLALGLGFAASASAAPEAPAPEAPARVSPMGWEFEGFYASHNDCTVAGGNLLRNDPSAITYACNQASDGEWALWLEYP